MIKFFRYILLSLIFIIFNQELHANEEVNVYSYRQPILIDPFFEEFTNTTGIKVNVLHAKKGCSKN